MKTKTIRQTVTFKASPHEVYERLMDSRKHAAFTGGRASISRKVGGKFNAYDDYITGTNLELVPDKKIVQSWRGSDWPEGHFSKAAFALKAVKGDTRLTFTQTGVPEEQYQSIKKGWIEFYWTPMKEMLAG
jgi:activator of HSP90 ATPase